MIKILENGKIELDEESIQDLVGKLFHATHELAKIHATIKMIDDDMIKLEVVDRAFNLTTDENENQ